jgi:hypothetical protein
VRSCGDTVTAGSGLFPIIFKKSKVNYASTYISGNTGAYSIRVNN